MNDLKRDLRQVSLSEVGREVLQDALRRNFPSFPNAVLPYKWKELTQSDRRTVERMLEPGKTVRLSSIVSVFADLNIVFDEGIYLNYLPPTNPSPLDEVTGPDDREPPAPYGSNSLSASQPDATVGQKRMPFRFVIAGVLFLIVALGADLIVRHKPEPAQIVTESPDTNGNREIVLYDDFRRENTLERTVWAVNGPQVKVSLGNLVTPTAAIVAPNISFDPENGVEISGIVKNSQEGGIQTSAAFKPPFTVTAQYMAGDSNAAPIQLALTNANGTAGVALSGQQGSGENDTGFISSGPRAGQAGWDELANISPIAPEEGVWYTLAVSVTARGQATMAVSSGDQVLGETTADIGAGPFYLVLGQGVGAQPASGPNESYCAALQIINGSSD